MHTPRTGEHVLRVLQALSVAALGIFVGAMLTEGFILVPYWQSLAPEQFFTWYAAHDRRLVGFFGPLTVAMAALAIATAVVAFVAHAPGRWLALLAAVISVTVVVMFPVYFQHANASFAAATVAPGDLPAELARWATW